MDDDQIREFSEKMSVRIASLEDRNDKLLETARRVEGEKRYAETELVRLQKEIRRLKQELDRLKSPPLIRSSPAQRSSRSLRSPTGTSAAWKSRCASYGRPWRIPS